jgi:hypothetical protein
MGIEQTIIDSVIVPVIMRTLDVEEHEALRIVECIDLRKLGQVLKEDGITEVYGINVQMFLDAVAEEEGA